MGGNPAEFKGDANPVEHVSWFDAIIFCNKLSEKHGFAPVYSVNGTTDVSRWRNMPDSDNYIKGKVKQDKKANGFRLPTEEEWEYAAKGGQDFKYSGSDKIDEAGWFSGNSGNTTHPVAQKMANGYGLYDMSGNVYEWCWDVEPKYRKNRCRRGGRYYGSDYYCEVGSRLSSYASRRDSSIGFRIVRNAD